MLNKHLSENFKKNSQGLYEVYDRFSFDNVFRLLLNNGYEYEEALNFIFCNCALSTLVFQERIYNKYYLKLSLKDKMSDDLVTLMYQTLFELLINNDLDIEKAKTAISEELKNCPLKSIKNSEGHYFKNVYSKKYRQEFVKKRKIKIHTIYGQLQSALGVEIKPAPDEWDRLYNVDFYIEVKAKYIGIQIKPTTFKHTFEDYKWKEMQETSHRKFEKKFGGKVFIVFSVKEGNKKVIANPEVIEEIRKEIKKLEEE